MNGLRNSRSDSLYLEDGFSGDVMKYRYDNAVTLPKDKLMR
jgi:hypothetical protein